SICFDARTPLMQVDAMRQAGLLWNGAREQILHVLVRSSRRSAGRGFASVQQCGKITPISDPPMASRPRRSSTPPDKKIVTAALLWAIMVAGCRDEVSPGPIVSHEHASAGHQPPLVPTVKTEVPEARGVDFVDVAHERGLDYVWPAQPHPMRALEAFGSGCAAFDGDNDGWQDVLLVGDPHPALFRSRGGTRFEDLTAASGLTAVEGNWTGCAVGDYDADGRLDVLLTGYHRLALYKNVGNLRFELATAQAGLDEFNHGQWGASAGFMDLDGDGRLDMVILNYVVFGPESKQFCEYFRGVLSGCTPKSYPPERGEIWRNVGGGRFELVPDSAGMKETTGVGLVLAFIDIEGDGRMDLYIGNDAVPADFLHNRGDMQFENTAVGYGLALDDNANAVASMGADWADYDRNGLLDLAVTNFQSLSFVLFRNMGNNCFINVAARTGLARATRNRLGFGAKWVDFENDGWPDLCFVNGHVYDNADEHGIDTHFRQPICLFRNESGKRFVDLVPVLGRSVQRTIVGRGSATADFNNDGRMDLLVVDYEGPAMLLENRTQSDNHWLKLDLRGIAPNIFAYGARVVGRAGDQTWLADVSPASSYLSSSDPRVHWGLGNVSRLETLVIRWPSGREQTLQNVRADRILRVEELPP
ncbi:MAG TPA: CRTAC1 family protein, partial [Planctomycetaceae bacterium]